MDVLRSRRRDEPFGRGGVRLAVALTFFLDRNRGEMHHRAATAEGAAQGRSIPHIADAELDGQLSQHHRRLRWIPDQCPYLPPVFRQLSTGMDTNHSSRPGYEDGSFLIR